MAKITDQERQVYFDRVKEYRAVTKAILKTEKDLVLESKKDEPEAILKKLILADEMLNLASFYIAINGVSQAVLKVKSEEALNDARKTLYKAVIYLEDTVSNFIDVPFSDYAKKLSAIESFDENQRYDLLRKMGFAIDLIEQAYGDNSKWRWTFVELEGRFATVAKNMIDLKNVLVNKAPESPYYDSTVYHLRLIKRLLTQAADRNREKYELSTGQTLDFKTSISFLGALKRLHTVLAEAEEAEEIKKKIVIWSAKLDTDLKKQEEAKKRL